MQFGQKSFPGRASLLAVSLFLLLAPVSHGASLQGFGASTPGGAGKTIYRVTNLNDSGAGSLREAVSQGNRNVVFDVAGVIELQSPVSVKGAFVTIDGFSAPSPGITVRAAGIRISGTGVHDVIVRGLRIRDPDINDDAGDGLTIKYGAYNVVVDHVSIDGCGDGNIDITKSAHDVTVAWSVFSGCAKNMLIKYEATRVTLHHNVFVDSQWRNPWISNLNEGIVADDITVDMRNNLVWGWGSSGGGTGIECGAKANVIANFYSSPDTSPDRQKKALMVNDCDAGSGGLAYTFGNRSGDLLGFDLNELGNQSAPFPAPFVDTHDACTGALDALAGAGTEPLDSVDLSYLGEISLPQCGTVSDPAPQPAPAPTDEEPLQLRVAAGIDDAEQSGAGSVALAHRLLQVGAGRLAGLRFSDVTIPVGSTIVSARLEMFSAGREADRISIRYRGEAAADSAAFAKSSRNLSQRSRTKAFVVDTPTGWTAAKYNRSPDLAALVQEIVDQSGWTSGRHLTLFLEDAGSSSYRKIVSFDGASRQAPVLVVTYTAPTR